MTNVIYDNAIFMPCSCIVDAADKHEKLFS